MATIVISKQSNKKFVLLGSGFGAYQSMKPHWFFGDAVRDTQEGEYALVCVCNEEGEIGWMDSSDVRVFSVDGQSVDALI